MKPLRMARQQLRRMTASGIFTSAARAFQQALDAVEKALGLKRSQKTELKTEAARAFMSSGFNTKKAIRKSFIAEGGDPTIGFSTAQMAAWAEGTQQARDVIYIKHMVGSDSIQFAAEVSEGDPERFNMMLGAARDAIMTSKDITGAELNTIILEYEGY